MEEDGGIIMGQHAVNNEAASGGQVVLKVLSLMSFMSVKYQ